MSELEIQIKDLSVYNSDSNKMELVMSLRSVSLSEKNQSLGENVDGHLHLRMSEGKRTHKEDLGTAFECPLEMLCSFLPLSDCTNCSRHLPCPLLSSTKSHLSL